MIQSHFGRRAFVNIAITSVELQTIKKNWGRTFMYFITKEDSKTVSSFTMFKFSKIYRHLSILWPQGTHKQFQGFNTSSCIWLYIIMQSKEYYRYSTWSDFLSTYCIREIGTAYKMFSISHYLLITFLFFIIWFKLEKGISTLPTLTSCCCD